MKRITFFCGLLFLLSGIGFGQGMEQLADRSAAGIHDFFSRENFLRTSIVTFENYSGLPDQIAQKFYQLLVVKLESHDRIQFSDLMINFERNHGVFNLSNVSNLDYLLYVRLIRNREKLGAGLVIFSKTLDKIVGVQYRETLLPEGEKQVFSVREFGFKALGFSRVVEIESRQDLLDIKSIQVSSGEYHYFFYYPERIEIFRQDDKLLEKVSSIPLRWETPYYPVLEFEGRLALFRINRDLYLTAGGNFSPHSKIFRHRNSQWEMYTKIEFVPFRFFQVNQQSYLAGSKYELGKNYFINKIYLVSMENADFSGGKIFEKSIPEFYSLDFAVSDGNLMSVHMIDRDYRYRFFAADFEEKTVENNKRGSSLIAMDDKWLAVSDFAKGTDTVYFYKIENGSRNLVYQNRISGEIVFVSAGRWKTFPGFWLLVRKGGKNDTGYYLEFWQKGEDSPVNGETADKKE
jgi:hypothetical protein